VIMLETTNECYLLNSVLAGNVAATDGGGLAFNSTDEGTVSNNIIIGNTGYGIHSDIGNNLLNFQIAYNDVYDNTLGNYGGSIWPQTGLLGNISEAPLFVAWTNDDDLTNDDFHLDTGSPCIDTGNPIADLDDVDGSQSDMGAYGGPYGGW